MVPKGLKVGDTFLDGNLRFVVCKVLANCNYECEVVKNVPEKTKETTVRKSELLSNASARHNWRALFITFAGA